MTSRINTPAAASASGETADVFAAIRKAVGMVPNAYAAIGALNTPALKAMLSADAVLAQGVLSAQDRETIKLVVSAIAGCDYCVAAHSLAGKASGLPVDTVRAIRALQPTGDAKRDALIQFVRHLQEGPRRRAIHGLARGGLSGRGRRGYRIGHRRHHVYERVQSCE